MLWFVEYQLKIRFILVYGLGIEACKQNIFKINFKIKINTINSFIQTPPRTAKCLFDSTPTTTAVDWNIPPFLHFISAEKDFCSLSPPCAEYKKIEKILVPNLFEFHARVTWLCYWTAIKQKRPFGSCQLQVGLYVSVLFGCWKWLFRIVPLAVRIV